MAIGVCGDKLGTKPYAKNEKLFEKKIWGFVY